MPMLDNCSKSIESNVNELHSPNAVGNTAINDVNISPSLHIDVNLPQSENNACGIAVNDGDKYAVLILWQLQNAKCPI